jgi:hypothetical protein
MHRSESRCEVMRLRWNRGDGGSVGLTWNERQQGGQLVNLDHQETQHHPGNARCARQPTGNARMLFHWEIGT